MLNIDDSTSLSHVVFVIGFTGIINDDSSSNFTKILLYLLNAFVKDYEHILTGQHIA